MDEVFGTHKFYELVGRWLSGEQPGDEVTGSPAASTKNWTNSADDLALARAVWEKFSPRAKALFTLLMDHPGHKFSGEELAVTLDIPHGKSGVAGVLAWPARHCAAIHRVVPWSWEDGPEGNGAYYWVNREMADLFEKVQN